MKKGIFINIAIITNLCILYLVARIDIDIFSAIPTIACFIATKQFCNIYVSHESKINKRRKIYLQILIVLNYLSILTLYCATIFDLHLLKYFIANGLITLYIILMTGYTSTIINIAREEKPSA